MKLMSGLIFRNHPKSIEQAFENFSGQSLGPCVLGTKDRVKFET